MRLPSVKSPNALEKPKDESECFGQDAHLTKKEILVSRGIIKAKPAENLRYQEDIPRGFSLNVCSHCNYRCRYCPQGVSPQPVSFIKIGLVKKLFDELQNRAVYLQISARGESLLHPNFFNIIHIAKEANEDTFICLNTNGSLINHDNAVKLISSGIDQIQISLQTTNETIYRRITGSKLHRKVMAGIIDLARLNAANNWKTLLTAQYLDIEDNRVHRGDFVEFCSHYGIQYHIQQQHSWGDKFFSDSVRDPARYPCPYLFLYPTINYNGQVNPCFIDFFGEYSYGSINKDPLSIVWASPKTQEMRKKHLNREWDDIPMCRNCEGYRLIPSGFTFSGDKFTY